MSKQKVHCRICTSILYTSFSSDDAGETCGEDCDKELSWRKQLAAKSSSYYPRKKTRHIRIAELDPVDELDSLIEDLKGVPGLSIERYIIPKEVYPIFASNPSGLEFPIATLEGDWEDERAGDQKARLYGLEVQSLLRELQIPSFAVTRKFKRSSIKMPLKDTINIDKMD